MGRRQWIILITVILVIYLAIRFLLPYIAPFVLGLFFASLAEPLVRWVERRWRLSRNLATGTVFLIILISFVGALVWAIGGAAREIKEYIDELPQNVKQGKIFIEWVNQFLIERWKTPPFELQRALSQATQSLLVLGSRAILELAGWLEKLPQIIGATVLSLLSAFFFIRDKHYWLNFIKKTLPPALLQTSKQLSNELLCAVLQVVRMEIVLMTWTFLLTGITLSWMNYSRPWLIGLLIGLLEPLPMMGPTAVLLPWSGWLLAMGQWRPALILIVLCGVIMLSRQWGELHFIGGQLGLNPIWTLLGIYIGFKCFGLRGLVIGPMVIVVLRSIFAAVYLQKPILEDGIDR